jgi:hypothetical protein
MRTAICMVPAMRSVRTIWLKTGVWPAFGAALLPMLVALFHLMPAMGYGPASPAQPQPAHHAHHQNTASDVDLAAASSDTQTAFNESCHPPGQPCDTAPRDRGMHCPLCLWLQGFHALPAPIAPALRMPSVQIVMVQRHEVPAGRSFIQFTSQARAPPLSPAV